MFRLLRYLAFPLTDIAVEDGFGHGTHVASTVAGYLAQTPDGTRLHGVAPRARLLSHKVRSDIESTIGQVQPISGCDSSNIIMALEDSVPPFTLNNPQLPKPVAHVINMSFGGSGGPDNPTAIGASNAALTGTIVVAASGTKAGNARKPLLGTRTSSSAMSAKREQDFPEVDLERTKTRAARGCGRERPRSQQNGRDMYMTFGGRKRMLPDQNTRLTRVGGEHDPEARMMTVNWSRPSAAALRIRPSAIAVAVGSGNLTGAQASRLQPSGLEHRASKRDACAPVRTLQS